MEYKKIPDIQRRNITLIGDFNPKIFQPAWFAAQKLILDKEQESAEIGIIHSNVSDFKLDWCRIQVTRDRFTITTNQEKSFDLIKDLVLGTFSLLNHTPIKMMGINNDVEFPIENIEKWHEFGHKLTPNEIWRKFLKNPGMINITIQDEREDDYKGYLRVMVEPSLNIKPGIFININDHFEENEEGKRLDIIKILNEYWDKSTEKSVYIINSLLENI